MSDSRPYRLVATRVDGPRPSRVIADLITLSAVEWWFTRLSSLGYRVEYFTRTNPHHPDHPRSEDSP